MSYRFFFDTISCKKQGISFFLLRQLLWLCSLFFGFLVSARRGLYALGIQKSVRLPACTISIGNIVAGGTGKTPLTIYLAKLLANKKTAVILGSYKAAATSPTKLSTDGANDPCIVGDEACLIARHVPEVEVWVAKKKAMAAKEAFKNGARVILIDDGFQHLAITSDVHIVVIDVENPFGYGHLLPRGLLREPLSGVKRAHLIVLNCRQREIDTTEMEKRLQKLTKAPIVKASMRIDGVFDCRDVKKELCPGVKVGLFCGIGKPEQFVRTVESLGASVVGTFFVEDHRAIDGDALQTFAQEMQQKGALLLLCTEKDRVKCPPEVSLPVYWLKMQMYLPEEAFFNFL